MVFNFHVAAVTHRFPWYSTNPVFGVHTEDPKKTFSENCEMENHTLAAYGLRFMDLWSKKAETK